MEMYDSFVITYILMDWGLGKYIWYKPGNLLEMFWKYDIKDHALGTHGRIAAN